MPKTKTDRRNERMHELMHEYIDPIVQRAQQHNADDGREFDWGAVNGIIKDRVAFFISEHYGVNFQMVRNYFACENTTLRAVEYFVKKEVPYDEVRGFYREETKLFKQRISELGEFPTSRRVRIRHRVSSECLRVTEDGYEWVDQIHSSGFDVFHSKEMTIAVVLKMIIKDPDMSVDDLDANWIKEGAERFYHYPAL